ncbi:MAG: LCP family protein [Clostridiales bacterium]|nr:LCP family protein [Clostridiales bacterium]
MFGKKKAIGNEAKPNKKSPAASFFKTVFIIVVCFIALSFVAVYAYTKATYTPEKGYEKAPSVTQVIGDMVKDDVNINILVCGVDEAETRTDVIFVANFDSESGTAKMLSIPRDTYTEVTPEVREKVNNAGKSIPSVVKMNAVHAYAGKEIGMECLAMQLEDLLDIEIDNYVLFNIEAFKAVVDIIGGVDMYVPYDMYYSDPVQGLYINLKEGQQHLDGDTAEQLVRNRQYANGDIGRIEVQQQFLSAFVKQVLDTDTIIKNLPSLIKAAFEYIKTDMSLGDMLKYATYIDDVKSSEILTETLPGYPQYINGASYYIADKSSIGQAVDEIFYSGGEFLTSSKHKNIEIANGGETMGLAGRARDTLENEGFTISKVSTYKGEQTDYTRIVVKEEGQGQDLLPYFENAVIVVDDLLLGGEDDILIILGLGQGEIQVPVTPPEGEQQ